ncbi:ATP-binding cassette sub-family G member 1-like isoform X2 [Hylaeus volcanicus]|nr:ATP-binding cassette sub-family G member 1-like isoform X2 [Hylaeus volcanicus]
MHHLNNTMKKVFLDEILKSFIGNEAISHLIDMVDVFFKLISSFIDSLEPNVVLETYQAKTSTETNVPEWILSFEMFLLNIYKRNVVFIQLSNAFLFHVIFVSFISYSNLLTFVRERSLFNREIKQNLYSTSAYFLSRSMIDIPLQTIPVVLMSLSFYVILGLHKLLDSQRSLLVLLVHSFLFIFICIVISIASYAFVSMVASISPSLAVAMCLLSMFLVTWLTTIGFLLRQIVFPTWIVPVQWISFYRWGFFALIKGTFLSFQTQHTILYRLILTLSGIPNLSLFFFFVFLVICITSYYAIAFLCLCFFHQNIGLLL